MVEKKGHDQPVGHISTWPMRLPTGETTALISVNFPTLIAAVSLPTAASFSAIGDQNKKRRFSTSRLEGAAVFSDGKIQLSDGTCLRDVVIKPTHLPYTPSQLDFQILRHVIAMTKSADRCFRSLRHGVKPRRLRRQIPKLGGLDYNAVKNIKRPPIKAVAQYLGKNAPHLKMVSPQKIADALGVFGIR